MMVCSRVVIAFIVTAASAQAKCSTNDRNYRAGGAQAQAQFNAAYRYAKHDCERLDAIESQVHDAAPSSPACLAEGFNDKLNELYHDELEKCPNCEDEGTELARKMWRSARQRIGDTCFENDQVFSETNQNAPVTPDCLHESFTAELTVLYNNALDACVSECQGYGVETGTRIGQQFCGVAALFADDEGDDELTIVICNEQEQEACENEFQDYIDSNCPSEDTNNQRNFKRDLLKACEATLGPQGTVPPIPSASPSPTPLPVVQYPQKITCEEKWQGRTDGPSCKTFQENKYCCKYSHNCGNLAKCTSSYCCREDPNAEYLLEPEVVEVNLEGGNGDQLPTDGSQGEATTVTTEIVDGVETITLNFEDGRRRTVRRALPQMKE